MLTKHQLVIAVLEWPIEAASQGAAALPREQCQEGWSRRRSPGHLRPLDCVLTTAPDPENHPDKPSRETADGAQPHFSLTEGKQPNGVRQARRLCAA